VEGPPGVCGGFKTATVPAIVPCLFSHEPYVTFLGNSQALWFDRMGDGKREGCPGDWRGWIAPDGQLCDAASPGCAIVKQGDGRIGIHDWGIEFTAAGSCFSPSSSSSVATPKQSPGTSHCWSAPRILSRAGADPKNNLFWPGPAGNLLAPSYAGWKRPMELTTRHTWPGFPSPTSLRSTGWRSFEALAGAKNKADLYRNRRDLARKGLPLLMTEEGYFIKQLDPDGARHGFTEQRSTATSRPWSTTTPWPSASSTMRKLKRSMKSWHPFPGCVPTASSLPITRGSMTCTRNPGPLAVRPMGQRRTLVDMRGAHDPSLLSSGQVRGGAPIECSTS